MYLSRGQASRVEPALHQAGNNETTPGHKEDTQETGSFRQLYGGSECMLLTRERCYVKRTIRVNRQ